MLWKLLRQAFRRRESLPDLVNRSLTLRRQGRYREVEQILRRAVAEHPHDAVAATNLGVTLLERNEAEEGVQWLHRALQCDPKWAPAHYNLGNANRAAGRVERALEHYQLAVDADPEFASAREELMQCLLETCSWDRAEAQAAALRSLIVHQPGERWMPLVSPFTALYLGLDPELKKQVAMHHAAACVRGFRAGEPWRPQDVAAADRIRIAYLSGDFRNHAVGHLLNGALALHDRSCFEVHAFSWGPDDGSGYRRSIVSSVDRFWDMRAASDEEFAAAIKRAGIHVVVDLAGHTLGNRLAMLARRPAPVQVHYLGYPGTIGAPWMDHFVTDHVATPPALRQEFTEHLIHLPNCFMVSDGSDAGAGGPPSREQEGLPRAALVFCNFNRASRITPQIFATWMTVLRAVPSAVLWLQASAIVVVENLRREAGRQGVAPERIVFARRVPSKADHLARLALADLMLDTVGWHNGHTSTSDALWAGVPVLTSPTDCFAGRVGSSLVTAAGLPELAVEDLDQYLGTAIRLGNDATCLAAFRSGLAAQRSTAAFFDTRRTIRDLESAYAAIWNEWRAAG